MKTTAEVRDGLVAVIKKIKTANGFLNDLPDDHITPYYSGAILNDTTDALYPKCLVCIQSGENQRLVGGNEERTLTFLIIVVVKKVEQTDNPITMVESFMMDLEKAIFENESLERTVDEANLVRFAVDDGALKDEGALVAEIVTKRMRHGGY